MTVRSAGYLSDRTAQLQVRVAGRAQAFLEKYGREMRKVPAQLAKQAEKILLEETKASVRANLNKDPTGALERSFRTEVRVDGNTATVRVASDKDYARIHDVGGTITPKSAAALTIPIHPMAVRRRAADFGDALFRLRGHPILAIKEGDTLIPLFALAQSVRIEATGYLAKARRKARARINEAIKASLQLAAELARSAA